MTSRDFDINQLTLSYDTTRKLWRTTHKNGKYLEASRPEGFVTVFKLLEQPLPDIWPDIIRLERRQRAGRSFPYLELCVAGLRFGGYWALRALDRIKELGSFQSPAVDVEREAGVTITQLLRCVREFATSHASKSIRDEARRTLKVLGVSWSESLHD